MYVRYSKTCKHWLHRGTNFEKPHTKEVNVLTFWVWVGNRKLDAICRNVKTVCIESETSCRLSIQLPIRYRQVQRIGNRQLVADCRFIFETDNTSSSNRLLATSCRLPTQLPIQYKQVQRIGNWQPVAGCRFRFETDNLSSSNWQLATSCRLPIQLPIRYRQVQRIGNRQLVADCRLRFETDNTSSTNRQLATSCR